VKPPKTAAIERFLRPVAWQGFPDVLLPPALREEKEENGGKLNA